MYSENPTIRDTAINQLVGGDDPKEDIIREVYMRVTLVADQEFTRNVLMNMHQSAKLRSGWDFDQPELMKIVNLGLSHSDPSARGYTYEILGAGMRKRGRSLSRFSSRARYPMNRKPNSGRLSRDCSAPDELGNSTPAPRRWNQGLKTNLRPWG